ncbi:prolyl oligopeptidase family serine peptidase [Tissierella sp. Yu-01]|uniref:prolyl oligopeptidase family serine peptidase n=1 Tax=Tissierella sp. Yu-01 TaxID=3035694 RepID=UPI00240D9AA5|nr:prolyl oligopeptidase family serine peptidase [Tissierella sp. Yu-01]WFA08199.1 prolyl oligopeptidase family serine peptidase [Tissierella sp. Yu-01]
MEYINVIERNVLIDEIPALVMTPKNNSGLHPTVILYHGWSSSIEKQSFRGFILSSLGYQVIIPCAIHHGSREPVDHSKAENAGKYFWKIIFNNIEESTKIIQFAVKELKADPERIGVCGNSMGGFTAAGVFASNTRLKALVVFNGSCNWNASNELFLEALNMEDVKAPEELQRKLNMYNPMGNLEHIINRPILILHGDSDTLVGIEAQREFYKEVSPKYDGSERLKFVEYPKLNHFVTTNMMEEAAIWFNKYL